MQPIPSGDEQLLRQRLDQTSPQTQVVSAETAQAIARWLARSLGPGFRAFIDSGLVTADLYRELTRLYDQRKPEAKHWLDALVRYCLTQTTVQAFPSGEGQVEGRDL